MEMQKKHALVELENGEMIGPIRITFAARVAFDRYARTQKTSVQESPHLATLFWAWWELKRTEKVTFSFDEAIQGKILDIEIENEKAESLPLEVPSDF